METETRSIIIILISKRLKNVLLLAKTHPRADCLIYDVPGATTFKLKEDMSTPKNVKLDLALFKFNQALQKNIVWLFKINLKF